MYSEVEFDEQLIRRYDSSGPRYTSYPTAMEFSPGLGEAQYAQWVRDSNDSGRALSLYVHIPFCAHVCYYCGCNKVVTADRSKAALYLERLYREVRLQASLVDHDRRVEQLHFGGGTPTFLSDAELYKLTDVLRENFHLTEDDSGEYSIEIDPRELREETLPMLRDIGFNRVSLGVQDFNPAVQQAVHREQSEPLTLGALQQARELGFESINIDLMYGLPLQTLESFSETLDKVIEVRPDRLSVFNYAHLPERFKPQRRINADELPAAAEKLAILALTIEKLTGSGYQYIGMDHFALVDDELSVAQRSGTLHRTFQGYSTHADTDLVSMGVSAISSLPAGYSQNHHQLEEYYASLDEGHLPVNRGVALSADDHLRREVIQQLVCNYTLNIRRVESEYSIDFADYFTEELRRLEPLEQDGLVNLSSRRIDVNPRGRLLIRNICRVFDRYRMADEEKFSRMI